ncbi:hypothetical protein ACIBAC_40260 [Streptomyces sp. NPDC051362]|uniref:hypothetical protein n=1 Tax=Streptomyces sp. NPDC051362 TaxID=3365651 RepID=UPI0037AF09E7
MLGKLSQDLLRADADTASYGPQPPADIRSKPQLRPQLILLIPPLRQPPLHSRTLPETLQRLGQRRLHHVSGQDRELRDHATLAGCGSAVW